MEQILKAKSKTVSRGHDMTFYFNKYLTKRSVISQNRVKLLWHTCRVGYLIPLHSFKTYSFINKVHFFQTIQQYFQWFLNLTLKAKNT